MDLTQAGGSAITDYGNALKSLQDQDASNRAFRVERQARAQQAALGQDQTMPTAQTALPDAAPVSVDSPTAAPATPAATSGAGPVTAPVSPQGVYGNPSETPNQTAAESARLGRSGTVAPFLPNTGLLNRGVNALIDKAGLGQNSPAAQAGRTAELNRLNPPSAGVQNQVLVPGRDDAAIAKLKATDAAIRGSTTTPAPADKPTQYDPVIQQAAQQAGIDPTILKRLLASESSFNPKAVSPRGAQYGYGIAQIAASHGLTQQQMEDPSVAIPFAAKLLRQYADANGGDMTKALLQYKGASSPGGIASMQPIVAKILTGLAPGTNAQAAQPPAPAQPTAAAQPAAPMGPGQTYTPGQGSNYDFDMAADTQKLTQLQQMFKTAQWKAQNAATSQEREAANAQLMQLQTAGQQLHAKLFSNSMLNGVRAVEAGDVGVLGKMIQSYSQNAGTPLVIHQVGQGQYALFSPDGRQVTQPGAPADLARAIYGKVAPSGRAVLAQNAQDFNTAYQAEAGKSAGGAQAAQQLEMLKGQNEVQKAIATGQLAIYLERAKQQGMDIKADPVSGGMYIFKPDGSLFARVAPPTPGSSTIGMQVQQGVLPIQMPK